MIETVLASISGERWLLELGFFVYLLGSLAFVVLERRHPRTTLAWVLAIILLPLLGLVAYLVIGRRPYRRHVRRGRRRRESAAVAARQLAALDELPDELSGTQRGLVRLALSAATAPLRRADRVAVIGAGVECFESIRDALEAARHFIHLEFYIWRDDPSGRAITAILTRRAREGVRVRVLLDHVGSFGLPRSHFADLLEAGGEVAYSSRILGPGLARLRANFRNHRKLISVDQQIGFVGGVNVADEYLGEGGGPGRWRDLMLRIEGEAVRGLETIFSTDWIDACGPEAEEALWVEEHRSERRHGPRETKGPLVQLVASGPDARVAAAIAAQLVAAIASAQSRCWIATPYLVPDDALKLTLQTAAMRGVDLRLLVPGRSDQWLVRMASASYYDALMDAGCRIYEYPQMIHSKFLVVDDTLAAVGSANMDIRSFHLNYEVTAMLYDAEVNAALAEIFERDLAEARPVDPQTRVGLSAARTAAEAFARVLSPLL